MSKPIRANQSKDKQFCSPAVVGRPDACLNTALVVKRLKVCAQQTSEVFCRELDKQSLDIGLLTKRCFEEVLQTMLKTVSFSPK